MSIKGIIDGTLSAYQAQINRTSQANAQRASNARDPKASAANQSQPAKDTVDVSFAGALRTVAFSTATSTGDVRQEKVDAIRESLDNGTYEIDSQKIALKLLQDESDIFGN